MKCLIRYGFYRHLGLSLCLVSGLATAQMDADPEANVFDLQGILGQAADPSFRQADPDYRMQFPQDHGLHPDFRNEWWYFTGHLEDEQQRAYGYQFTLFRLALDAEEATEGNDHSLSTSHWRGRHMYMAHLALSVPAEGRFIQEERFSRGAPGLAGAQVEPFSFWLYDWQLETLHTGSEPPWRLQLKGDGFALDLQLSNDAPGGKPRVLQGEQGYSRKGSAGASHYYSYPRLNTRGSLQLDGKTFPVKGNSWFDREWGSGALGAHQSGWDWFSVQLDDGRDLMWYQLRLKSGGIDTASNGVLIASDGGTQSLSSQDISAEPSRHWHAPDGRCYPVAWQLNLASESLQLEALMPNQAWSGAFRYWEGAAAVHGSANGRAYVELSGYPVVEQCPPLP